MTRDPKSPELPSDSLQSLSSTGGDAKGAPRRAYTAPRLKRLGSVRDLTLGSRGAVTDGLRLQPRM
jgi:hypothetical protein